MSDPVFKAIPGSDGWSVQVEWPSGKIDAIPGFTHQYEALEWIKRSAANWLTERIMNDPNV